MKMGYCTGVKDVPSRQSEIWLHCSACAMDALLSQGCLQPHHWGDGCAIESDRMWMQRGVYAQCGGESWHIAGATSLLALIALSRGGIGSSYEYLGSNGWGRRWS